MKVRQHGSAHVIAERASIEPCDMRRAPGDRRVDHDSDRPEGVAAQLQSTLELFQEGIAGRLNEVPKNRILSPSRPRGLAPCATARIGTAVPLLENMTHRTKEGDDGNILRLIVGRGPHHIIVALESGDKVTDEVELRAGNKHYSQHSEGRSGVGGRMEVFNACGLAPFDPAKRCESDAFEITCVVFGAANYACAGVGSTISLIAIAMFHPLWPWSYSGAT